MLENLFRDYSVISVQSAKLLRRVYDIVFKASFVISWTKIPQR